MEKNSRAVREKKFKCSKGKRGNKDSNAVGKKRGKRGGKDSRAEKVKRGKKERGGGKTVCGMGKNVTKTIQTKWGT